MPPQVRLPQFDRELARQVDGIQVIIGDPRRIDTYVKADLGPSTCVIAAETCSASAVIELTVATGASTPAALKAIDG